VLSREGAKLAERIARLVPPPEFESYHATLGS
jgi:hypothetical protein